MPGGKYYIRTHVDGQDEIFRNFRTANRYLTEGAQNAAYRTDSFLSTLIYSTFEAAAENAGEGFPAIYTIHLLATVGAHPPTIKQNGMGFTAEYDFGKLGGKEDLESSYHYHAMLQSGGKVELPYGSAALKNDVYSRYQFWLALSQKIHIPGKAPVTGLLEETYAARVANWSSQGVAPQWLLLNYGQGEYYPFIRPFAIVEGIREALAIGARSIFAEEVIAAADKIEGLGRGVRGASGKARPLLLGASGTESEIFSGEGLSKMSKFPDAYGGLIARVLSAKTPEEISAATYQLSNLEAVEFAALRDILKPKTRKLPFYPDTRFGP